MRNKKEQIGMIVGTIVSVIVILFFLIISGKLDYSPEPKINYVGLEHEENLKARELIKIINSSYIKPIKSITIVKNIRDFCSYNNKSKGCRTCKKRGGCGGWNDNDNIVVRYSNEKKCTISSTYIDDEDPYDGSCMKLTLCHEILHSIHPSGGDWFSPSHQKIFRLAHEEVCYK